MAGRRGKSGIGGNSAALFAAAAILIGVPGASLAVARTVSLSAAETTAMPFTPSRIDPVLARKVAAVIGEDGLRFTPAIKTVRPGKRSVTVAVRVDPETARAISIRGAIDQVSAEQSRERALVLAPTSYNLGIARGLQSFAQPTKPATVSSLGLADIEMPDLAAFAPSQGTPGKAPRLASRIAFGNEVEPGRAPRTLGGNGEQSVDVQTSYRLNRNLNVTAGVRVSQDRNRLTKLTDGLEDDKAVYVGTQIRF